MLQTVGFEEKVDVGAELNALARRHREQAIVVQHRIQCLDPLRVDVPVADDPTMYRSVFDYLNFEIFFRDIRNGCFLNSPL